MGIKNVFTVCLVLASVVVGAVIGHPNRNRARFGLKVRVCEDNQRVHRESGACFPLGLRGPCGEHMLFVEGNDSTHGACECQDHFGCEYWPFTYWQAGNRCYPLYEQGPCAGNEWLVNRQKAPGGGGGHRKGRRSSGSGSIQGVCMPRTCEDEDDDGVPGKTFLHQGKCFQVGTQAFCSTPGERAYFRQGSAAPSCFLNQVRTEVCQRQLHGGGTVQQIVIVTPPPVAVTPIPPPALDSTTSVPLNTTLRTLGNAGQIPCAAGAAKSSTGDCVSLALFR